MKGVMKGFLANKPERALVKDVTSCGFAFQFGPKNRQSDFAVTF